MVYEFVLGPEADEPQCANSRGMRRTRLDSISTRGKTGAQGARPCRKEKRKQLLRRKKVHKPSCSTCVTGLFRMNRYDLNPQSPDRRWPSMSALRMTILSEAGLDMSQMGRLRTIYFFCFFPWLRLDPTTESAGDKIIGKRSGPCRHEQSVPQYRLRMCGQHAYRTKQDVSSTQFRLSLESKDLTLPVRSSPMAATSDTFLV